jgi:hypothetical protein
MADLRTALQEAIEQHRPEVEEKEVIAAPVEKSSEEVVDPVIDKARDEKGKFAKTEKVEAQPAIAAEPAIKRPSSWKKEFWETFDKVDPTLRNPMEKYIAEREDQFHKGLEGYKSKAQLADEWTQAMSPFMQNFQALGKSPVNAVRDLVTFENALRNGSPQQKLAMLNTLIRDYGIDISGNVQPQQQPQFDPNQVNQMVEQRVNETFAQREVNNALNDFMANPPEHFEAVKETMVKLLQSEMASSYKEAYDKATRLHPEVMEAIQAKQHEESEAMKRAEADKAAKAAKTKAVSVKGTSTGAKTVSGGTDRRSMIAEQFRDAQSRI